jgi:hypothetical protein
MWRIWALALGEKAGKHDREADKVAIVRTLIFASYLITNIAIVANAWRHWEKEPCIPQATKKESLDSPSLTLTP